MKTFYVASYGKNNDKTKEVKSRSHNMFTFD